MLLVIHALSGVCGLVISRRRHTHP